jgi:amidohydrolase
MLSSLYAAAGGWNEPNWAGKGLVKNMDKQQLKQAIRDRINALEPMLWDVVMTLYNNPETAFKEYESSALLVGKLREHQFEVVPGVGGLDTAFCATQVGREAGSTVAIVAEYDALPELGHACGHNLIAAAALGAGLAVGEVMDHLPGRIQVIGTPAEEGGGGKCILVNAGVFKAVDAAMMFHPSRKNMVTRPSLASVRLLVAFHGKPAHAASTPDKGINALEGCIQLFNNINALRQHMKYRTRIAGIITHGGVAANIVPAYCTAEFSVRGTTPQHRKAVLARVIDCAEAAAQATGCRLEFEINEGYNNIYPNPTLAQLFTQNAAAVGRVIVEPDPNEPIGSTDMGNVSHVVPAIHPYLATVGPDVAGHTVTFRETCVSDAGRSSMMDAAKALAMTAVDLLSDPSLVTRAKAELAATLAQAAE